MSPLRALLWAKWRVGVHTVASVREESKLKVAVVSVAALAMWFGLFRLAHFGFYNFELFGDELLQGGGLSFADLVMSRLLSTFSLTLMVLLFVSNLLVAYATFFRSREVPYLVQSPLPVSTLFLGRFVESVSFSSWASAFLGSPILLAYGLSSDAPLIFYPAVVLYFVPFVVIPAAAACMTTLTVVRVLSARPKLAVPAAALLAVGGGAVFALVRRRLGQPDLSDPAGFASVVRALGGSQSPFLPSQWLSDGVLSAATGDLAGAAFSLFLLVANAAFLVWLATLVAERVFYPAWSDFLGADEQRAPQTAGRGVRGRALQAFEIVTKPLPEPMRSLVVKDLRLFWREPSQWGQFLVLFGIMAVYLANMRGEVASISRESWQAWGTILNLAASMLILASLTSRFVYPLISLEGRRIWILGLAPLTMRQVVVQKFWLSVATTSFFTIGLAIISSLRLELGRFELGLSVATVAATTLALSGLAVGLGALYPNFEEDNPSRIVSGLGGTLNFFLSMLYILLVTGALAAVLLTARVPDLSGGLRVAIFGGAFVIVALLTALATWLPLRLGIRNLQTMEL